MGRRYKPITTDAKTITANLISTTQIQHTCKLNIEIAQLVEGPLNTLWNRNLNSNLPLHKERKPGSHPSRACSFCAAEMLQSQQHNSESMVIKNKAGMPLETSMVPTAHREKNKCLHPKLKSPCNKIPPLRQQAVSSEGES